MRHLVSLANQTDICVPANSRLQESELQDDDQHCLTSDSRGSATDSQKDTRVHHSHVQTAYVSTQGSSECKYSCFVILLDTDVHTLGPHCQRGNQSYVRCMAGGQRGCLFCRHRALDRGARAWRVDLGARPTRVCTNELLPQRHASRANAVHRSRPTSHRSQGKSLASQPISLTSLMYRSDT
jgi:hypothetical protein